VGAQDYINKDELMTEASVVKALRYSIERQKLVIEVKRAKSELFQQKAFLESILNNVGEGIAVMNQDKQIIMSNPAVKRIIGQKLEIEPLKTDENDLDFPSRSSTPLPVEDLPYVRALKGEFVQNTEFFLKNDTFPEGMALITTNRSDTE